MESYQNTADGIVYNNGYGICMIPKTQLTTGQLHDSYTISGGYISSYMHNTVLPGIVTKLQTILGSHIVQRNVLLSSDTNGSHSNAYTWTTAYTTLMSIGQMTGIFAENTNKYDDGEANYKLPLFNSEEFKTGSPFWSRGINGMRGGAWAVQVDGSLLTPHPNTSLGVRPLIYLR